MLIFSKLTFTACGTVTAICQIRAVYYDVVHDCNHRLAGEACRVVLAGRWLGWRGRVVLAGKEARMARPSGGFGGEGG